MKYLPIRQLRHLFIATTLMAIFVSCNNQEAPVAERQTTKEETAKQSLFSTYFDEETQKAVQLIKAEFDEGIARDFDFDRVSAAYEYNNKTIRQDLFNDIPYTLTFPYDGTFDLTKFQDQVEKIPFLTNKCGFQDAENDRLINYYCLNLNPVYFEYLEELSKTNSLIDFFRKDYQKAKSITPNAKQAILLQALEELDFENVDHQLFYMFFHIGVNEERMAADKLKEKK